jgi:hypothetical protein
MLHVHSQQSVTCACARVQRFKAHIGAQCGIRYKALLAHDFLHDVGQELHEWHGFN